MNLLFSCIGKRGYIAEYFREVLAPGDRIIGTSNTVWTPGFAACDEAVLMPPIADPGYTEAVLALCRAKQIGGLLSFYDPDVMALARLYDQLESVGVVPIIPREPAAEACFDKFTTDQFLREGGFDTPLTFVDLAEAHRALDRGAMEFPLIVKPRCGFGSHDTFTVRTRRQLDVLFEVRPDMLIQQFIDGPAYDFDICNDLQGRPVSLVVWRKLRSTMGETENVITCDHPELFRIGLRLGEYVGQIGPMDVDLFWKDGRAYIIEMNPRFGGGYPASHLAGGEFPRLIMHMIRREPVPNILGSYRPGTVMIKVPTVLGGPQTEFWQTRLHLPPQPLLDVR